MSEIIIVAETGSDVSAAEAAELGIELVPMHVSIGDRTIDDGTLDPAEMLEECRQLGVLPKTSGCTPGDFGKNAASWAFCPRRADALRVTLRRCSTASMQSIPRRRSSISPIPR